VRATAVSTIKTGLVSIILTMFVAAPVAAASSVTLQWRGQTSTHLSAGDGNGNLVAPIVDIILNVDNGANTVTGVFISVSYTNEVSFTGAGGELAAVDLPGMGNEFVPLTSGLTDNGSIVSNFDTGTLGVGLVAGNSRTLGSMVFSINQANRNNDGLPDLTVVVQQNGIDGIVDSSGTRCAGALPRNDCPYTFGSLFVPEPTTSALVVLGLGMGVFYSRRR